MAVDDTGVLKNLRKARRPFDCRVENGSLLPMGRWIVMVEPA